VTAPARGRTSAYQRIRDVVVVDTAPVWCVGARCPATVGSDLVRMDSVHVTPQAAAGASAAMSEVFAAAGVPFGRPG
jgi:hypothetical protein